MRTSPPWSLFEIGVLVATLLCFAVLVVKVLPVPRTGEREQGSRAVQQQASGPGGSGPHVESQGDALGGGAPPSDSADDQGSTAPSEKSADSRSGKNGSGSSLLQGEALCYEIENFINPMFNATFTKCLPPAGMEPGTTSLILISEKRVFSDEAAKKAWLVAVVGAVGYVANQHHDLRLHNVIVSDVARMKERRAWKLPGETVKSLQRRVHDGEINFDQFIIGILGAMQEMPHRQKGRPVANSRSRIVWTRNRKVSLAEGERA